MLFAVHSALDVELLLLRKDFPETDPAQSILNFAHLRQKQTKPSLGGDADEEPHCKTCKDIDRVPVLSLRLENSSAHALIGEDAKAVLRRKVGAQSLGEVSCV